LEDANDKSDIWQVVTTGEASPTVFLATDANERSPQVSPDGRFVAYVSDETGEDEVYVRPFPQGEGRWRISAEGGRHPKWNGDGTELFFVEGEQDATTLMAVTTDLGSGFQSGLPEKLFFGPKSQAPLYIYGDSMYDPAPDGQRFVVVRSVVEGEPIVTVVQNWAELLEKNSQ